MSRQLIESIVSNNMLEANDMVEAKLAEIRDRKIYEMKRMFAAKMDEVTGGLTKAEIEARKKAGYKRASEVLRDPRDVKTPNVNQGAKIVKKKISEDWKTSVAKGVKRTKTRLKVMSHVPGALKDIAVGAAKGAIHNVVSDPLPAAGAAVGAAARATGKVAGKLVPKKTIKRLAQKISDHEPAAPGSAVVNATKRLAGSQITQDVKDIAFRNI